MTTHREPLDSVLDTVGETPLVRVHAAPPDVPVYAKLESFNPGASVKDRIGKYMLERMLERGDLSEGGTVVEPTAGNTGIGFAVAARQLGVNAVFVVPERFSVGRSARRSSTRPPRRGWAGPSTGPTDSPRSWTTPSSPSSSRTP
jgi:cysteine synthase A